MPYKKKMKDRLINFVNLEIVEVDAGNLLFCQMIPKYLWSL